MSSSVRPELGSERADEQVQDTSGGEVVADAGSVLEAAAHAQKQTEAVVGIGRPRLQDQRAGPKAVDRWAGCALLVLLPAGERVRQACQVARRRPRIADARLVDVAHPAAFQLAGQTPIKLSRSIGGRAYAP